MQVLVHGEVLNQIGGVRARGRKNVVGEFGSIYAFAFGLERWDHALFKADVYWVSCLQRRDTR